MCDNQVHAWASTTSCASRQGKESELAATSMCVQVATGKLTLLKVKAEDGDDKMRQQRAYAQLPSPVKVQNV